METQLELFGGVDRLPRRPYCSDDLSAGLRIRSLRQAITKPYLQINPPHLRVWSIYDVDREGGALAWEHAGLPPPAWAAVNRANGHAHLVWGLSAPVLVDSPDMRQAPMRYLCAIEAAFREKLQADPGYSGLITKNPAHPLWRVLRGPRLGYELGELAEWVDLPKHLPRRKPEQIGLGRNVTLFDWLRHYAYRHVRRYKLEVRNFVVWQSHLNTAALQRNGDFRYPLDGREVWHIVKSVSKWVWRRFDIEASDARFSALQAARGRLGGLAKGAANEDKRASARLMRAQGYSSRAIAQVLGVNQSTVIRWLAQG
jgi:DNA-directed RNA polymerase specialized sigma24 family protein